MYKTGSLCAFMQTKYQSIVFLGKTGSGKGTQAHRVADELEYDVFSTGDKVREIASGDTPLAKRIQEIHVSGWVPEWLASYLMVRALLEEANGSGLVFESVARKPLEAEKFHEIHEMLERPYIIIHLEASDEVVRGRMLERKRDAADLEENIEKRLAAYKEETLQSLAFFEKRGKVVTVPAEDDVEVVFKNIMKALTA